ncbi:MIP aquaporin family [Rhizoctonia solani]|uniref:MIP aquaporin family n=1 Tax=Rhizoctonia solani TaxID=456999 RepID=A0A8H7IAA2_9AGAM|nr:MIP aquaporin family [Rhizoctonia solani]
MSSPSNHSPKQYAIYHHYPSRTAVASHETVEALNPAHPLSDDALHDNRSRCQLPKHVDVFTASFITPKGNYATVSLAWGTGLALGAWSRPESLYGGSSQPGRNTCTSDLPWIFLKKVPGYMLAQVLGACVGAALIYANYHIAINIYEGGIILCPVTPELIAIVIQADYMTNALGTFLLVFVVLAVTDKRNGQFLGSLFPRIVHGTLVSQCEYRLSDRVCTAYSFALNPARDLGPRLLCWFVGYGRDVWNYRAQYWLYAPIVSLRRVMEHGF